MKALLASLCSIFAASAAGAASVTVPDNSTSLAGVAAATTALLLDAGLKPQNAGGGVFVLDAKNFHCDQHLNGALDASSVRAGLPTLKCRINSQNKRGTTAGQPFGGGRAMTELLQKVQGSNPPGRPSAIAAWAIAASSRSPSSAPSIPRSAISATAAGGAAFSRTGSDDRAAKPDPAAVSRSRAPPLILCYQCRRRASRGCLDFAGLTGGRCFPLRALGSAWEAPGRPRTIQRAGGLPAALAVPPSPPRRAGTR